MKKSSFLFLFLIFSFGLFAQNGKLAFSFEAINGISLTQQRSAYYDDRMTAAYCYGAKARIIYSPWNRIFSVYGGAGIEKFQEGFKVTKSVEFNPSYKVPLIKIQQNRQSLSAGIQLLFKINEKLFIAHQSGIKFFRSTHSSNLNGFVKYQDSTGTQHLYYTIYPYYNKDLILFETGLTLGIKVSPKIHLLAGLSTQYSFRQMGSYVMNYSTNVPNKYYNGLFLASYGTAIYSNLGVVFKIL